MEMKLDLKYNSSFGDISSSASQALVADVTAEVGVTFNGDLQ